MQSTLRHSISRKLQGKELLISGRSNWTPLTLILEPECYEFWRVTGTGNLVGVKRGDILIVGGTKGSYTFQVPDTAPYKTYDTDNIWFKIDATQRTTTEAELVGYDFTKTIVKYLNIAPYSIEYVMILSSSFGTTNENIMRDDMSLSMWWSNVLSLHGYPKQNRGIGKSVWTPE